jgi:Leucine-rich repeat (LRR) protein
MEVITVKLETSEREHHHRTGDIKMDTGERSGKRRSRNSKRGSRRTAGPGFQDSGPGAGEVAAARPGDRSKGRGGPVTDGDGQTPGPPQFIHAPAGKTTALHSDPRDPGTVEADVESPIDAYVVPPARPRPKALLVHSQLYTDPNRWSRRGRLGVAALIVSLLLVIMVGATLLIVKNKQGGEGDAFAESPSAAPTGIPPDPLEVLEPIFGNIMAMGDTAYVKMAFNWLTSTTNNNTYSLGLLEDWRTQEWQILQRYVLAYLYFATFGSGWTHQLNFLADVDECEWFQVVETWIAEDDNTPRDERGNTTKAGVSSCDQEGRITGLVLRNNGLGNWIPYREIANTLLKLQILDLSNAYFDPVAERETFNTSEGIALPSEIGQLTDLHVLYVGENGITGTLSSYLWMNLTNLNYLWMYDNFIEGSIPTELGALTGLKSINLRVNALTGSIPSEIGLLTDLQRLSLDFNQLTGRLPSVYGEAWGVSIEYFSSFSNQLTGSLPEAYGNWTNIADVYLYDNRFTGTLPPTYGNWTNIEHLWLYSNSLTGTLPPSYGNWTNIVEVAFDDNILTGTLPFSYGNWMNIEEVYFFDNRLSGTLPSSYGGWTNIEWLWLYSNSLSGTLPYSYGNWTNISYLWLFSNSLTGTLPASYGNWTSIMEVGLNDNTLTGTLPFSYGAWGATLQLAYFDVNQLVGTFPPDYGSWKKISAVNFSSNCLEGTIPESYELQWLKFDSIVAAGIFGPQSNATAVGQCIKDTEG